VPFKYNLRRYTAEQRRRHRRPEIKQYLLTSSTESRGRRRRRAAARRFVFSLFSPAGKEELAFRLIFRKHVIDELCRIYGLPYTYDWTRCFSWSSPETNLRETVCVAALSKD
jgi:hypothetical protein